MKVRIAPVSADSAVIHNPLWFYSLAAYQCLAVEIGARIPREDAGRKKPLNHPPMILDKEHMMLAQKR